MRRPIIFVIALLGGLLSAGAFTLHSGTPTAQAAGTPVFSSPGVVTFDFVPVGTQSATRLFNVSNAGSAPLRFSNVTVAGRDGKDFRVTQDGCTGVTLAPGASCAVGIAFAPTVAGTRVATVRFKDNTPCASWVNLAGSGTQTLPPVAGRAATCESVVDGGSTVTTVANTTTVTTTTQGGGTSGAVSGASVVALPTARTCASRRVVTVHLTAPKGRTFTRVKILLHGKTLKTLKGKSIRAKISLRGLPRGRFTLEVRASVDDGTKYTNKKHYVTCIKDRK
jgi:Abnormal spindle-like microcephaly-assoc'd, ASPM-SPD-2-Hydin